MQNKFCPSQADEFFDINSINGKNGNLQPLYAIKDKAAWEKEKVYVDVTTIF